MKLQHQSCGDESGTKWKPNHSAECQLRDMCVQPSSQNFQADTPLPVQICDFSIEAPQQFEMTRETELSP
jgi:hypothetical protein